jgi:hypothetical protein
MKISRKTLIGVHVLTLFLALILMALEVRILTQPEQTLLQPCTRCAPATHDAQPAPIRSI